MFLSFDYWHLSSQLLGLLFFHSSIRYGVAHFLSYLLLLYTLSSGALSKKGPHLRIDINCPPSDKMRFCISTSDIYSEFQNHRVICLLMLSLGYTMGSSNSPCRYSSSPLIYCILHLISSLFFNYTLHSVLFCICVRSTA